MTTDIAEPAAGAGNLKGIAAVSVGLALLVVNDMLMKLAGATLPVGELMFVRGVMASALILALCAWKGALRNARQMLAWQVSGRAVANLLSSICYITALLQMPIANLTAITQASPLLLTALAALALRERVGWRRWLAIAIGFGGVLIIVRPASADFNAYTLVAMAGIFFVAARDLFTKRVKGDTPSMLVTLATALVVTSGGGIMVLLHGWVPVGGRELAYLAPSALLLVIGYHLVIVGFRAGEVAVVAPFRFSMVLWAILGGYFIWNEVPDQWTILGTGLIVAMGLYTFHRERMRARNAEPLAAAARREI